MATEENPKYIRRITRRRPLHAQQPSQVAEQQQVAVEKLLSALQNAGAGDDWQIKSKAGTITAVGKTNLGGAVTFSTFEENGYSERTMSVSRNQTVDQRRAEARRQTALGRTQATIAANLGVSQKTISNDLRAKDD